MKYRFNAEDIKDDYKKLQIEPFSAEQAHIKAYQGRATVVPSYNSRGEVQHTLFKYYKPKTR